MDAYHITVKIVIEPDTTPIMDAPVEHADGSFQLTISALDAGNIDRCEQALLRTVSPALRTALGSHLSAVSYRHACAQPLEGDIWTDTREYRVDGEVGRFTVATHWIEQAGKCVYDTGQSVFPPLHGKEWYKTTGFKEIALIHGTTENSYQKTHRLINRLRHQEEEDGTPSRTLREGVVQEGTRLLEFLERKTDAILRQHEFHAEGSPTTARAAYCQDPVTIATETVTQAIVACELSAEEQADVTRNPVVYEAPAESVNISLDDVVVKQQKTERTAASADRTRHDTSATGTVNASKSRKKPPTKRKYVHDTVAHLQHGDSAYTVCGRSVVAVLRIILGYLLNNAALTHRIQFFVDGQKTLQAAIIKAFSWYRNVGLILDWYHLEDKCKRQLSSAMTGRDVRNEALREVTRLLWYGMVDRAQTSLRALQPEVLKDHDAIRVLIQYLERNRPYIPCYGVRQRLGLRNSSNIGEKMNDLLVSARQKHHGMSWSKSGSIHLAALEMLKRNHEYQTWFEMDELAFKWAA